MTAEAVQLPARLRTNPQQARSQARIAAALDAAVRLLEREGAEAVTTTRVALEASMAVGSVYRYFPDKAAILDTLWTRYLAEFVQLMDELRSRAEREVWDDPVGLVVDAYADFYRARPALRAIWFGGRLSDDVLAKERRNDLTVAEGLRRLLLTRGLPDSDQLPLRCYTVVLATDALLKEAFRADPGGDALLLEECKAVVRAYLSYLATRS